MIYLKKLKKLRGVPRSQASNNLLGPVDFDVHESHRLVEMLTSAGLRESEGGLQLFLNQ